MGSLRGVLTRSKKVFSRDRYSGDVLLKRSSENCMLVTRRLRNTTSSLPWLTLVRVGVVRYLRVGGSVTPRGSSSTEVKPLPWSRNWFSHVSVWSTRRTREEVSVAAAGSWVGSSTDSKSPESMRPGVDTWDVTPGPPGGAERASGPGASVTARTSLGPGVSSGGASRRSRSSDES